MAAVQADRISVMATERQKVLKGKFLLLLNYLSDVFCGAVMGLEGHIKLLPTMTVKII